MRAIVNKEECTGCGLCVDTCPEVLEMEDDVARVVIDPVPPDQEEALREAAEECPSEAIVIEE